MRRLLIALWGALSLIPGIAPAATGGTGGGFGPEDWIAKWPVLAVIFVLVIGTTTFLATRIFARAKAKKEAA